MRRILHHVKICFLCIGWILSYANIVQGDDCQRSLQEADKLLLLEKTQIAKYKGNVEQAQQELQQVRKQLQEVISTLDSTNHELQGIQHVLQTRTVVLTTMSFLMAVGACLFGIYLGVKTRHAATRPQ